MFYELKHPLTSDYFKTEEGENFAFPSHMHHCFELLCVKSGEMEVEIDEKNYRLSAGDGLLIFPNQIHSMKTPEGASSRHILCLFSTRLVSAFSERIASRIPEDNRFRPDAFYLGQLQQLSQSCTKIALKGFLYSVCGAFDETAAYLDAGDRPAMLLHTVFRFIEENYRTACTLYDLSRHTGYDYAYLSRYFKKNVGISYNDYVNQYRISEACYLLQNRKMTVLDIASECGFNTVRSFNRHFREQLNTTPAEYRRKVRENTAAAR